MNKALWSKKALALPACAAILVGGLTLTASPANADPADLKLTSQSVTNGVLTLEGKGTPGENVILLKGFPNERHVIADDGSWTIDYTLPDNKAHTYELQQQNGFNEDGSLTIEVAAQPVFAVTNHSVSGRTLTVTGTGTPGLTVQVDPPNGGVNRVRIPADGNWSLTYQIPENAGTETRTYRILEQNDGFQTQAEASFTAAAEAQQAEFSVTSPANNSTVDSRTVTFTGTAREGDQINLLDENGDRLGGFDNFARVGADGKWSLDVTFPETADRQQAVRVTDVRGGSGAGDTTVNITLPAAIGTPLTLTTPKDGSTVDSRTVTYSGTGTPGDAIAVVNAEGDVVAPATVVKEDGTWTTTGTFSDSAAVQQDLTVGELDSDLNVVDTIDFSITLPAASTGTGTPAPGTGTTPAPGTTPAGTAPAAGAAPVGTLPVVAG